MIALKALRFGEIGFHQSGARALCQNAFFRQPGGKRQSLKAVANLCAMFGQLLFRLYAR